MNHPIFQSIRSVLIYFATWILIAGIHVAVLMIFYHQSFLFAFSDSIVFNFLFCMLGLSIWFAVHYNRPEKSKVFNLFINHLSLLALVLLLWLGIGVGLLNAISNDNSTYKEFLSASIPWRLISGLFFYFIIVLIYYLIIYYNNLQEKLVNEVKLKELVKESELNLLKAQINPHFLFNSLNSISSLTMTNPAKAQDMIIKLSDFLRYTISFHEDRFSTLEKELENIKRYLEIEQVRFGSRLQYDWEIEDDCLQQKIPLMILQPLFENAVKHGVYESTEPIIIQTKCSLHENFMQIIIRNNFEPFSKSRKGEGIGLKNCKERLKLLYKNDQLLKTNINDLVFEVALIIPIEAS